MKHLWLTLLLITTNVSAETFWKLGAGIGNISANSYPGSNETEAITSPIPYLKIKTDWFDLDREGLHTNWFENTKFRLDFTFDLGLPVDSNKNEIRNGMADLDPVGLIGPMLIYQLEDSQSRKWQLQLPLAFAYSFDNLEPDSAGWILNPRIYFNYLLGKKHTYEFGFSLGPLYGSSDYHQYYYDVSSAYVTVDRPAYTTQDGFGGYRANFSLTTYRKNIWFGAYLRYQDISEAVFVDSPLVTETNYWFIAVGVSWIFAGNY